MAPIGTVTASQDYKNLIHLILGKTINQGVQKGAFRCPDASPRSEPSPFEKSFLDFLIALFLWPKTLSMSYKTRQQVIKLAPLHPTAQLIQDLILALPPFVNMTPETLSNLAASVEIPSWIIGTEEACHIASAAARTFGRVARIETPPPSAYTAAGYELCRVSYDAFECSGPGRIMTLEYDGDLAVASMMQTPLSSWSAISVTFSARTGLTSYSMIEWINAFIDSQSPDMLILAGSRTDDPLFIDALAKSQAASFLHDNSPLLPAHILALGAAQTAKDRLESQIDDCSELEECVDLRWKADAIAGPFRPLVPSTWPATGLRHDEARYDKANRDEL
jgi:hypothetical protein